MSYALTPNFSIPSQPSVSIPVFDVVPSNFSYPSTTDKAHKPGSIISMESPADAQEWYFLQSRLGHGLYANENDIGRARQAPYTGKVNIYLQHKSYWFARDPERPDDPEYLLPMTSSISLTVPTISMVTEQNVKDEISRLLGILYPGAVSALPRYLRGATNILNY